MQHMCHDTAHWGGESQACSPSAGCPTSGSVQGSVCPAVHPKEVFRHSCWDLGEKIVEKAQLLNAGVQVFPSQGRKFKRLLPVSIKDILMGAVNSPQGLRSLSVSFTSLHLHMFQHFSKVHLLCYCPDGLNSSQWDPNNSCRAQRTSQTAQEPFSPSYSPR